MRRLLFPTLFLLFFACGKAAAQRNHFTILTYNTENSFDTIASNEHLDHDFTPKGTYRWSIGRYYKKLRRLAQVILAADTAHPADLILLQEVESDTVMDHLLHRTALRQMGYEYVITHSLDARGINVAVVYSPRTFQFISADTLRGSDMATRDILHLSGQLNSGDTLDIYNLHLPSRLGAAEAQRNRRQLAMLLTRHIDSIAHCRQHPLVLVAGDFNANPTERLVRTLCQEAQLHNLMADLPDGSYKFQGRWEWIDQMLVNDNLRQLLPQPPRRLLSQLLEPDATYGGQKPFRAFLGPIYHGGYSDHLPVVLQIHF